VKAVKARIALVGFGEVGQTLAEDLHRKGGVDLHVWDRLFPVKGSEPRHAVCAHKFVAAAGAMAGAVRGCTLVISAVTAGECRAVAQEAALAITPGAFYLDLNSVSPGTKAEAARAIEEAGGRYVEAAVMSAIHPRGIAAPMWLGGPRAWEFLPVAQSFGLAGAAVFSEEIGVASAAKMCRSVIVKGMEALFTESLLTARKYGVGDTVLDSLADLFPGGDWHERARYMIARSMQHGRRRAEEMREAARTVAEAGFLPWMTTGTIDRHEWAAAHAEARHAETLAEMLDLLSAPEDAEQSAGKAARG
jgi:3-hydroxyisobutyrate dehydrogenase-like beta-hydroxyacid dehydrogenase